MLKNGAQIRIRRTRGLDQVILFTGPYQIRGNHFGEDWTVLYNILSTCANPTTNPWACINISGLLSKSMGLDVVERCWWFLKTKCCKMSLWRKTRQIQKEAAHWLAMISEVCFSSDVRTDMSLAQKAIARWFASFDSHITTLMVFLCTTQFSTKIPTNARLWDHD